MQDILKIVEVPIVVLLKQWNCELILASFMSIGSGSDDDACCLGSGAHGVCLVLIKFSSTIWGHVIAVNRNQHPNSITVVRTTRIAHCFTSGETVTDAPPLQGHR